MHQRFYLPLGQCCALLLILIAVSGAAFSQRNQTKPQASDDVLRTNTELVQTMFTVSDKDGRFVDGLKKENFELRVDGQSVPISFFENIISGSDRDRTAVLSTSKRSEPETTEPLSFRQRTIIFFVDDRHLSLESIDRTRKALSGFIDREMGQNDLVAIASSSGQIGFLQQFTRSRIKKRGAYLET